MAQGVMVGHLHHLHIAGCNHQTGIEIARGDHGLPCGRRQCHALQCAEQRHAYRQRQQHVAKLPQQSASL